MLRRLAEVFGCAAIGLAECTVGTRTAVVVCVLVDRTGVVSGATAVKCATGADLDGFVLAAAGCGSSVSGAVTGGAWVDGSTVGSTALTTGATTGLTASMTGATALVTGLTTGATASVTGSTTVPTVSATGSTIGRTAAT